MPNGTYAVSWECCRCENVHRSECDIVETIDMLKMLLSASEEVVPVNSIMVSIGDVDVTVKFLLIIALS